MSWVRVPLVTLKKEAVSNETKRYSLYFGILGMSMVPAEIYHDYLRLSRNLVGGYHAHPSIRVVISWHDIIISCHNTIISWHDIIISSCVWFEATG